MPPKTRISKQMITDAAFEIVREKGYEQINARNIASFLNCSTQPVLYHFRTVDEIRQSAYGKADAYHSEFIMPKEDDEDPLLALGLNYVRFAYEESNLFRFLFQTDHFDGMDMETILENEDLAGIIAIVAQGTGCSREQAKELFMSFFLLVHGLASLLANNSMEYDETMCQKILEKQFDILTSAKG